MELVSSEPAVMDRVIEYCKRVDREFKLKMGDIIWFEKQRRLLST